MQTDSRVAAGVRAALAAALGYVILWIVLEAGKIAFGRKRIEFDAPTTFTWTKRDDDDAAFHLLAPKKVSGANILPVKKDRLLLQCDEVRVMIASTEGTLAFRYDRVNADGNVLMLDDVTHISGVTRELVIPREAMGQWRPEIPCRDRRVSWLARGVVQPFRRLAPRFVHRIGHARRRNLFVCQITFGPYCIRALTWIFFGEVVLHWTRHADQAVTQ
jgi:leader peptidase (prepilin peptidase)/N-methyltransferase